MKYIPDAYIVFLFGHECILIFLIVATMLNVGWNPVGVTVAGTSVIGVDAARLNFPVAVAVNSVKSVYVADRLNDRVQLWLNGSSNGTTVAGSSIGTTGFSLTLLNSPSDIELDSNGNIYIADSQNNRVVLWNVSATIGTLVAGTGRRFFDRLL